MPLKLSLFSSQLLSVHHHHHHLTQQDPHGHHHQHPHHIPHYHHRQVDLDESASSKYADAEGLITKAEFVRLGNLNESS